MKNPNFILEYENELSVKLIHLKSGSEIITDAPIDNNGRGSSFSPTDMVASGLASCMITVLAIHFQNKGEVLHPVKAKVQKIMDSNPRRISEIRVEFDFGKNLWNKKEWAIVQRVIETCPVANSLSTSTKILTNLKELSDDLG